MVAAFATFVAALSHTVGGGAPPGLLAVVLSMAFSTILCLTVAGGRLTLTPNGDRGGVHAVRAARAVLRAGCGADRVLGFDEPSPSRDGLVIDHELAHVVRGADAVRARRGGRRHGLRDPARRASTAGDVAGGSRRGRLGAAACSAARRSVAASASARRSPAAREHAPDRVVRDASSGSAGAVRRRLSSVIRRSARPRIRARRGSEPLHIGTCRIGDPRTESGSS